MSLTLPKPVINYLAAVEAKEARILTLCFADDAIVHDAGAGDRRDQRHGRGHGPQVDNGRRFCRHHCAFTSSRSQQPALFIKTDIATARGVQEVEDKLLKSWSGIDILVNCVGGSSAPSGGSGRSRTRNGKKH